ncbi:hypothetical protein V2J09_012280, partial [Rumex salicifolius]
SWCSLKIPLLKPSPNPPTLSPSSTTPINSPPQITPELSNSSPPLHTDLEPTSDPVGIVTRSKNNVFKPIQKLNLHAKLQPQTEPKTITQALKDLDWRQTMAAKFTALCLNDTWDLVLVDPTHNLVGSKSVFVQSLITALAKRFSLKDMGNLYYFLGVEVQPHPNGLFLSQCKYISDILHRAQMAESRGVATPMCSTTILTKNSGYLLSSPTTNMQLVGSLQYLSLTRPDVAFAVNKLSQYMQAPKSEHWASLKRLLRYLNGTTDQGVVIYSNTPSTLHCFSDVDWVGDKDDYASTTGYLIYFGKTPISWRSRKQRSVSRSSTEVEYRALADTASELLWVLSLLCELGFQKLELPGPPELQSCFPFKNEAHHHSFSFYQRIGHISTKDQLADILTKSLHRQ